MPGFRHFQHLPVVPSDKRPEALLPAGLPTPHDVDPPDLFVPSGEPERLEGDRDLRGPSPVRDLGLGVPYPIPGLVDAPPAVRSVVLGGEIVLDPVGIDPEPVRALVIVIGVQDDAHVVVGVKRPVPRDHPSLDLLRLIVEHLQTDVEMLFVVENPDHGLRRRGDPLLRLSKDEVRRGLGFIPTGIVQPSIYPRRQIGPDGPHRSPVRRAVLSSRNIPTQENDEQTCHNSPY